VDSAEKQHWRQKRTFWGVALAVVASALVELSPLASIRGVLKALETSGLAIAGYGAGAARLIAKCLPRTPPRSARHRLPRRWPARCPGQSATTTRARSRLMIPS
jgi:hypothetical protein